MLDEFEDNSSKMSYIGFYYLVNQVVEGEKLNLTVKNAIDDTYSYLGIENDFYYDYESIDIILLINCFEICKSIFLASYDKGYEYIEESNDFISTLSLGDLGYHEKLKILRNCLAHNDYDYSSYMSMWVSSEWRGLNVGFSIDIIDFYNYTRSHLQSLHQVWGSSIYIGEPSNDIKISTFEDAKEYVHQCLVNSGEASASYILQILENDDFLEIINLAISSSVDCIKKNIIKDLNSYIEFTRRNIVQCLDTFDTLFDFIESVRFHLNYDRQNCLDYQYALISDNYFNYCVNFKKFGMYRANFVKEWEELGGVYNFYQGLDVKQDMNELLEKAIKNFSIFFYSRSLNEGNDFPYDKFVVSYPISCTEADIKRHLRNSTAHRNYSIEGECLIFKDYNKRTNKLTFKGKIEYFHMKNFILNNFYSLPYEGAYY
ncbi:TPA: hypothetical protein ACMDO2_004614 [Vibrio parahaemolyticus]|uniref:Uncharacterized protein n=1 Tax=Vibrio parahaemolyticus TaxID=670 RepID=A0AA46L0Y9_VIBPH|nr:hypothetical protein [Vibrio parahaemolyticus]TXN13592.1 hypothetical protein FVP01_23125 [Vibrio parahaemolyticus]